jgi:hypothetical protein
VFSGKLSFCVETRSTAFGHPSQSGPCDSPEDVGHIVEQALRDTAAPDGDSAVAHAQKEELVRPYDSEDERNRQENEGEGGQ